jgi:hypothetical protein
MSNKRDHLATFRINKDVWEQFQEWSTAKDISASLALCKLVEMCVDGKIQGLNSDKPDEQKQAVTVEDFQQLKERMELLEENFKTIINDAAPSLVT